MPNYRLLLYSAPDGTPLAEDFPAESDEDALAQAEWAMLDTANIERAMVLLDGRVVGSRGDPEKAAAGRKYQGSQPGAQAVRDQILTHWRGVVQQERDALALWKQGGVRTHTNGVDSTAQDTLDWELRIDDLQALIQRANKSGS